MIWSAFSLILNDNKLLFAQVGPIIIFQKEFRGQNKQLNYHQLVLSKKDIHPWAILSVKAQYMNLN